MSFPPNNPINLIIRLPSSHPSLLQGLDIWLNLGLISDAQVRQLCRDKLICQVVLQPLTVAEPAEEANNVLLNARDVVSHEPIFIPAEIPAEDREESPLPRKPNLVGSMFQSLQAELSVRWLLFLGMFLVVVSSGVLAASQWERFPGFLQYGILLAYTLSFWGASFWAGKQPNLSLTAGALLIVTLLLIPVNFWAMDTFGLWYSVLGWIVLAIATIILTSVTILLGKNRLFTTHRSQRRLSLINLLGLSYLHWGWKLPTVPLIAVYAAMIGTTVIMVWQTLQKPGSTPTESEQPRLTVNLSTIAIAYALGMVLLRAIFLVRVDITQLGLAIGICGWLVHWLAQHSPRYVQEKKEVFPLQAIGGILLGLGWLVAVNTHPEQAIAVSGLAVWFFHSRLQTYGLKRDLGVIFAIGLQAVWLGWRLVPSELRTSLVTTATQITSSQNHPWVLLSVALFPYIIFMIGTSDRFYRQEKRRLGLFGEQLTLALGVTLTTISLVNPLVRSLNLIFSTITLGIVTHRRANKTALVYITHLTGLLTVCSTIHWYLPNLKQEIWAGILLAMMVAEFLYSVGEGVWRRSAWVFGLILAGFSFILLWENTGLVGTNIIVSQSSRGVMWLVTPAMLTVVGIRNQTRNQEVQPTLNVSTPFDVQVATSPSFNIDLSVGTLIVAQLLTLPVANVRLIGLLAGVVLMAVNTFYLRQNLYALITVGFGLGAVGAGLWQFLPGLTLASWLVIGSVSILGLWLGKKLLHKQHRELATIYAVAFDKWAIALCVVELLILSFHSVLVYQNTTQPGWLYVTATAITLVGIITRTTRESSIPSFYGIGWCLELLVTEILAFGDRSTIKIAIANLALGFAAQLLGEWWQRKHHLQNLPSRWHILPLIYGVFGVALRLDTFASWTGLSSLALALIAVNIGRRTSKLKPLVYLGMAGISIAAYELLFYQLSQASGGAMGDGVIAMAVLGTSIMYAYRLLSPWLTKYFRLQPQELQAYAHIHWVISSCFLILATSLPYTAIPLALGTAAFLVRYAIFQGRITQHKIPADMWVYLGLLEAGIFSIYAQKLPIGRAWQSILLPWQSAIAAVLAYFIFILPWERWGWNRTPWRNAAYALPLIILCLSWSAVVPITLIIVAGFYLFVAKATSTFRFSYVSLGLVDWAIWKWCVKFNLNDPLWYISILGLSLLYIAQIDPHLRQPAAKSQRHFVSILGSSLICGWAVVFNQDTALLPAIISLITVFAGLGLRVRAFLYVGTATFFMTVSYQSIVLSLQYSFLKWVIGLLAGIMLISIAANFETQRDRLNLLIRSIGDELGKWQ